MFLFELDSNIQTSKDHSKEKEEESGGFIIDETLLKVSNEYVGP